MKNIAILILVGALLFPAGDKAPEPQKKSNINFIPEPVIVDVEDPCDEVQENTRKRFRLFGRIRRG